MHTTTTMFRCIELQLCLDAYNYNYDYDNYNYGDEVLENPTYSTPRSKPVPPTAKYKPRLVLVYIFYKVTVNT